MIHINPILDILLIGLLFNLVFITHLQERAIQREVKLNKMLAKLNKIHVGGQSNDTRYN